MAWYQFILIILLAVSLTTILGYLAACAGAGKWLTFKEWW